MTIQIRGARRSDLPRIYDLLDVAFPEAPHELFVNQIECDSTFRLRHARVAVEGSTIVAHARVFARLMLARGVPVAAAGVGAVATHPDAGEDLSAERNGTLRSAIVSGSA